MKLRRIGQVEWQDVHFFVEVAHARQLTSTRKPWKPCHSERSEESRSDLFVLASSRTRARFFASLRMTARFQSS